MICCDGCAVTGSVTTRLSKRLSLPVLYRVPTFARYQTSRLSRMAVATVLSLPFPVPLPSTICR
jgi:hypothetical protein